MEINGRTGFFCLIGSPVGHSGSPAMYNYSFQKTEQDYVYLAFDVAYKGQFHLRLTAEELERILTKED